MTTNLVRSALLAALLTIHALALGALRPADVIPPGPQVKVGKLANGLTYYIQRNGKPADKLELRLVLKAGSIVEDDDQQGLAHFVEHMAFNGSANFKKHELVSYLQSIGVKYGADLNAYTGFDETVYILPIPTERREHIEKGFLVLKDWAGGLTLNDADIDAERAIVLEETRLGKGAADRMNKVLLPKMFNGSRYARRLPIGQEKVIKNFKPAALRRFYRDWYRPDLMAVVAVGDLDLDQAEQLIKAHFGSLKNPPRARARQATRIPVRAKTEALVITDKEAGSNSLLIRYPVQHAPYGGTFGEYREQLVESLMSAMLNQRLQELAQLPAPPFLGGGSGMSRLTAYYKSYQSQAALGPGGALAAIDALVQENQRARQYGFSAAELERATRSMLRGYERAWNERDKTDSARHAAEYIRHFLEQESIPGIDNEYRYVRELIPGITLEEVNAYARRSIPSDAAKLVVYMGSNKDGAAIPTPSKLLAAVTAAGKVALTVHHDQKVAASLMPLPPAAGRIVDETEDKLLGLTRLTLSNGVKVILKPTDFRNDQVLMSAARFGGQALFGDADILHARYADAIVAAMGLNDWSPVEMQKILAGKSASVGTSLSGYSEGVSGSAGSNDIETMLQLVHLRFSGVRRDQGLYRSFVARRAEAARNVMAQPESVFRDAEIAALYNNHPRVARAPRPDDFARLDLDRAIAIYRQRFSSAKGLTFILVGSFEVDKIKPLLATYLASLPAPDLPVELRDPGVRPVRGVVSKEVRSGAADKASISINFTGEAEYSEVEQLRLQALVEVMNLRITEVLRENMGLIYGGGMSGSLSKLPYPNYGIGLALPTGPDSTAKVIAATFAEIARLKERGPDQADLDKVKQNWQQGYRKSLRENGFWLGRLQTALIQQLDPHAILNYERLVAGLSADDVRRAAQRYLDTDNYVQVVLLPEQARGAR